MTKYRNQKTHSLTFHPEKDKALIEYIENKGRKATSYIKELIKKDMKFSTSD